MAAWGASPEDWLHLDLVLGLGQDLLPVVSDQTVEISEHSKMKAVGKTPSVINHAGKAAGIPNWTQKEATPRELQAWSKEDRYGICLQTRTVRALDVDVPDVQMAIGVADAFCEALGVELPCRLRDGTGKRLLAFRVRGGELAKRSFKVDGGLIEFLATGQQFVAVGTHPSGGRYVWDGGLPDQIPEVSLEQFEAAWDKIVLAFSIGEERRASGSERRRGEDLETEDPVANWLLEHWPTYGSRGGKLFVECPWKSGHSMDSGETEAAWLLAGTSGYQLGHFECLHASCHSRTDQDFQAAVGYDIAGFEDLSVAENYLAVARETRPKASTHELSLPLPGFVRDKSGRVEAVIENVVRAVEHPQVCGYDLRFDEFRAELMISEPGVDAWRPFKDADNVTLRMRLAAAPGANFKPVGKEMMRDAVVKVAEERRFDTAIEWLENIVPAWDGVERIDESLIRYFRAQNDNRGYSRAVAAYMWTALAGRILSPGCKVDMVPVFVGRQGARKSSGVAALSPAEDFFTEVALEHKDADLSRKLRGKLVVELGELRGLKSREAESIKAWITARHERWTPKYMEYETIFPRRCVLIGTTNDDEFLGDPTGERRWLPVRVEGRVDVEALERDRLQLWAEARERFRKGGVVWQEAEALAKEEHAGFKERDVWDDAVSAWLSEEDIAGETPMTKGWVRSIDVLTGALGYDPKHVAKREEMRIARVMLSLGYERCYVWADGRNVRAWKKA